MYLKVYFLFCLALTSSIHSQKALTSTTRYLNNKDEPPDDQQSLMSRFVSWVFPFSSSAEDKSDFTGGLQYLPPSPSQSHIEKDCNACNLEPWIPIIPSVGDRNIPYLPGFSALETLHPPVLQYEAPHQFTSSSVRHNYVVPKRPPQQFTAQTYIPPPRQTNDVLVDYMLPPPINYKIPPLIYKAFKPSFTPPKPLYEYKNHYIENFLSPPPLHNGLPQGFITETSIPVAPSDSYGAPVTGDSLNYLPPSNSEQLSQPNEQVYVQKPVPLPNLSLFPVLPYRNHENFDKNFDRAQHNEITDVKIQESVQIADYLASIEHPINIVQSPLIELSIADHALKDDGSKGGNNLEQSYAREEQTARQLYDNILGKTPAKLSENPIIVEDIHAEASSNNNTFIDSNEAHIKRSNDDDIGTNELPAYNEDNYVTITASNFTTPQLDYSAWRPTYDITSPTLKSIRPKGFSAYSTTTKKPKVLQIIVPYVTNKWVKSDTRNAYTTLGAMDTPPLTTQESVWAKYMDELKPVETDPVVATALPETTTKLYNIKDILKKEDEYVFDILSLQKHIDNWTQQAYSQNAIKKIKKKLSTPKEIPSEYLTTESSAYTAETTTNVNVETTTRTSWQNIFSKGYVTVSPQTKEKVYVVTPQAYSFYTSTPATAWSSAPKVENGKVNNGSMFDSYKFSIRVEPQNKTSRQILEKGVKSSVKIVYSEWPHLINNLQTTTPSPSSRHPLFGLMDLSEYTFPQNSTDQSVFKHSPVASNETSSNNES